MKKVLFILAFIMLTSSIVKSQNIENYFLPDFIDVENCGLVEFNSVEDTWLFLARGHHYFITTGLGAIYPNSSVEGYIPGVLDRAQPCYTDTLLTVIGVAIGVNRFASGIGSLTKFTFTGLLK